MKHLLLIIISFTASISCLLAMDGRHITFINNDANNIILVNNAYTNLVSNLILSPGATQFIQPCPKTDCVIIQCNLVTHEPVKIFLHINYLESRIRWGDVIKFQYNIHKEELDIILNNTTKLQSFSTKKPLCIFNIK